MMFVSPAYLVTGLQKHGLPSKAKASEAHNSSSSLADAQMVAYMTPASISRGRDTGRDFGGVVVVSSERLARRSSEASELQALTYNLMHNIMESFPPGVFHRLKDKSWLSLS
jgi:hypothetical protein